MKARLLLMFLFTLMCVAAIHQAIISKSEYHKLKVKPDYIIELYTQDSVLVQSNDIIYKCHFDSIQQIIYKDNL